MNGYYYSVNDYYKELFGHKVYKISLNAGTSCPNRDGRIGTGGCIFCSEGGSGDFASSSLLSVKNQIDYGIEKISKNTQETVISHIFKPLPIRMLPLTD